MNVEISNCCLLHVWLLTRWQAGTGRFWLAASDCLMRVVIKVAPCLSALRWHNANWGCMHSSAAEFFPCRDWLDLWCCQVSVNYWVLNWGEDRGKRYFIGWLVFKLPQKNAWLTTWDEFAFASSLNANLWIAYVKKISQSTEQTLLCGSSGIHAICFSVNVA